MPQSLAKNLIHLIYSTKDRAPSLSPEIRAELFGYKAGILKEWKSPALIIGGVADHVHILFSLFQESRLGKGDRGGEEGFVQMDEDARAAISRVLLAGGLWCLFGEPVQCRTGPPVH